ncbi:MULTISPECIES: hypothetical protein [Rhizobium]|uniref:hypothetical protein n=1 Tax=Rhizobium TaxID=379 RepID=UPI001C91535E|nr:MULTISPECIES: hypothetical protein [Rhizobium]MBY3081849.1 hypothetical protein [Rhizobium laguerreae]MBY3271384.1 hypothetical protein [Rhizobium laguerreae]MBY3294473.1 hypothetical protein [Rhizobium laguerreae]MBY3327345.1 hypothetical protein [Rhizobium laguerreae]MBY3495649.1 hypothetical protein [Rhizobium laguerreae]
MSRYASVAILALLVIIGAGYAFVVREDDATSILRFGKLDARWQKVARKAIEDIVRPSELQQDYAFNEPRANRAIAFVVFDSRLSAVRSTKVGSCGYYPASKYVFCDVRFLDAFLTQRDLDKQVVPFEGNRPINQLFELEPLPPEEYDANRRFLLQWVIGHEYGHFLAGHEASQFAPTPLDARVEAKSVSQANEIEADAFLAKHFNPSSGPEQQFYAFLIGLLNTEIRRKACPGLSPLQYCNKILFGAGIYSPSSAIYFKTGGTHPEYMIRLVRLLKEAHQRYGLGEIGLLNDKIVSSFQEETRGEASCIFRIICW